MPWIHDCKNDGGPSDNIVGLLFVFEKIEIEIRSKVLRMDSDMLINSIGGAVGLFLGLSLMDILFMICNGLWRAKDFVMEPSMT